jgi:DNA processing protein
LISKDQILHLNFITDIGPAAIYGYIKKQRPGVLESFGLPEEDYFVNQKTLSLIKEGLENTKAQFAEELLLIKKNNINITTIFDEDYPQALKEVHLPPPVLYWKGVSINYENCIAVVGARKGDFLAKEAVDLLVPPLVEKGFTVVSGGAIGVDTMAHKSALSNCGVTIAVLGSGLLNLYPLPNISLFNDIQKTGAIVSSFPLTFPPMPENFPARNRIIAGFSKGTVVVQAAKKSGARITAEYALEQGRDVFAVPGPFNHNLSEGCNRLIQQGAKLVFSPKDILSEYFYCKPEPAKNKVKVESESQISLIEEDPVLALCLSPKGLEEIQFELKMPLNQLQDRLFDLQIEGRIKQNFAGLWHRI